MHQVCVCTRCVCVYQVCGCDSVCVCVCEGVCVCVTGVSVYEGVSVCDRCEWERGVRDKYMGV